MTELPIHPQAAGFLQEMAAQGAPPLYTLPLADARAATAGVAALIGAGPDVASVRDVEVPVGTHAVPARIYEPVAHPPATVVYLHGGGWVIGGVEDWDAVCRLLAAESGCRLVSVGYRLAPEHPFPAAVDDAYGATAWAAETFGPKGLVVAGDSAGANLAAVVALRARDEGGPEIALQLLVYPVVDHDLTTGSYERYADAGMVVNRAEMEWFWNAYVPDPARRADPHASPLRAADHSGLPPAYVVVAEHDVLRDEVLAYAAKLEAAGVPLTLRRYEDQIHAFFVLVNVFDRANEAVADAAAWIRASLDTPD